MLNSSVKLSGRKRALTYGHELLKNTFVVSPSGEYPPHNGHVKAADYHDNTDCHPFWHIRRSGFVTELNCDVVQVEITNITNSPMAELTAELTTDGKTPSAPTTAVTSFTVSIPFIVNTAKIEVGKELVVYMEKKPEEKKSAAKRKIVTPFTQESSSSSKSHKKK